MNTRRFLQPLCTPVLTASAVYSAGRIAVQTCGAGVLRDAVDRDVRAVGI